MIRAALRALSSQQRQGPQVSANRAPSPALIWCDLSSVGTEILQQGGSRLRLCSSKDKEADQRKGLERRLIHLTCAGSRRSCLRRGAASLYGRRSPLHRPRRFLTQPRILLKGRSLQPASLSTRFLPAALGGRGRNLCGPLHLTNNGPGALDQQAPSLGVARFGDDLASSMRLCASFLGFTLKSVTRALERRTGHSIISTGSAYESECLPDQSAPVFGQKKPPGGVKRWLSGGLAGGFRHLAVGWQPSGAAMECSASWLSLLKWET